MSKSLIKSNLAERFPTRALLAVSLCATMAAFGCTTDRTLGNGDPVVTPGSRTSPTSGTSAGSESEAVPPPMMSSMSSSMSSSFSNGSVPVRTIHGRLSADEAAAIMAQQQPRVRVLGPVSPGPRSYASNQMMVAQQQSGGATSVNSTLYSGPTEVITSGAGEPVAGVVDTSGVVVAGTDGSAAPTITGSSVATGSTTMAGSATNVTNAAAPVIAPSGTTITPTSSAVSNPATFASVRTLSPTAASVVNPPASISGSPAVATTSSSRTRTITTSNATTASPSVSTTTNVGVANPVRVVNTNGRVTVTNTGATRQQ